MAASAPSVPLIPDLPEYDHSLSPLHPHNIAVAEIRGWKFDSDFQLYRGPHGDIIAPEAEPQPNPVDQWR